jgi:hypothetical protein
MPADALKHFPPQTRQLRRKSRLPRLIGRSIQNNAARIAGSDEGAALHLMGRLQRGEFRAPHAYAQERGHGTEHVVFGLPVSRKRRGVDRHAKR